MCKMHRVLFILTSITGFICFLYGIANILSDVESNSCRMTYMFQQPQYLRIHFKNNKQFPNYGLYYYYEGNRVRDLKTVNLIGAPVIFVPGNGGSYKQVRSLASVALQKGLSSSKKQQLDYFTIDYNEELSGLHGGYLAEQHVFLSECINTVLKLYKASSASNQKIVLIGHSMGGKVAQSMLMNESISQLINSIVFIASPLDQPVVNFDLAINMFYRETNKHNRLLYAAVNNTNPELNLTEQPINKSANKYNVQNVLLVSIGGGNRDLLVHEGLTTSQYSDVHAMTSAIPNVWLSCDHLSAVWCLQLMLVINRFLFSILSTPKNQKDLSFIEDKAHRLHKAQFFFSKVANRKNYDVVNFNYKLDSNDVWEEEDTQLSYAKVYKSGIRHVSYQMISLITNLQFNIFAAVTNIDNMDLVYGCVAKKNVNNINYCEEGLQLTHYAHTIPYKDANRLVVMLDPAKLRKLYSNWTHIVFRTPPTRQQVKLNIDIHAPNERSIHIQSEKWRALFVKILIEEIKAETSYYKLYFTDLTEPVQALRIYIKTHNCSSSNYQLTAEVSVPWARGFDKYYQFTAENKRTSFLMSVPVSIPNAYNATENPVQLTLYLDQHCRYTISYQISFADTMARIVRQFYYYLLGHITAIWLLALTHQLSLRSKFLPIEYRKVILNCFQPSAILILIVSRVLYKFILAVEVFPKPDNFNESLHVAVIIHCTALITAALITFGVWMLLALQSRALYMFSSWAKLSLWSSSLFRHMFALSVGVALLSIALYSSGGLALTFGCVFYFMKMIKNYRDYLQYKQLRDVQKQQNSAEIECLTASSNKKEPINVHFQMPLFLLLLMIVIINAPATFSFVWSWRYSPTLADPALIPAIIILTCLSILWQLKVPIKMRGDKLVTLILYACACICLMYCQESVYRLSFIIAFVFVILLIQQLISMICLQNVLDVSK